MKDPRNKGAQRLSAFIKNVKYFNVPICNRYCRYIGSETQKNDNNANRITGIGKTKETEDDCICGRNKESHNEDESIPSNTKFESCLWWSGEMMFSGAGNPEVEGTRSKYIRLNGFNHTIDNRAEYKNALLKLLCDTGLWSMPQPQVIIEVTGTAVDKDLETVDVKVVEDLKVGIVAAARDAHGWIVTGGSDSGIMKLVGDEVGRQHRLDYAIPCLGIASWGVVKNRKHLKNHGLSTATYYLYDKEKDYGTYLNHGHNYFLLIDNGREKLYGEEIHFRYEMIHHIASKVGEARSKDKLPIVMLAVGGGVGTLQTIEDCFGLARTNVVDSEEQTTSPKNEKKQTTPVVIPYGFGGASDLLADVFLKFANKMDNDIKNDDLVLFIKENSNFKRTLGKGDADNLVERIKNCFEAAKKNNKLLTVFFRGESKSPNSLLMTKSLDDAILRAAAANYSSIVALKLAREWNAYLTACDTLDRNKQSLNKNDANIADLMHSSIAFGQVHFLELLLHHRLIKDVTLKRNDTECIFDKAMRETSASHSNLNATSFLNYIADSDTSRKSDLQQQICNLGVLFSEMIGCYIQNVFELHANVPTDTCVVHCGSALQNKATERGELEKITQNRDVFLLQLVLNQHSMAKYLWRQCGDIIGTALIASVFLRNLAHLAEKKDRLVLGEAYLEQSEIWEMRARNVLDEFDDFRESKSSWVLNRSLQTWQNRSVFEIAFYGRCMTFVEHAAVQKKLSHIWYGRISSFTRSIWVYTAALIWPLVFSLEFIPYDSTNKKGNEEAVDMGCHPCLRRKKDRVNPEEIYRADGVNLEVINYYVERKKDKFVLSRPCRGIRFFDAVKSFSEATMVRFFWQALCQFAFLLMFSAFILKGSLNPYQPDFHEILVIVSSVCFLIDIVHETYADDLHVANRLKKDKICTFFQTAVKSRFNILRWSDVDFYMTYIPITTTILLIVAFLLRMSLSPGDYEYPLSMYAIACLLFWIRTMRIFYASESIGMIVVILTELLPTTFYFLVVYIFMLIAFSIPVYALMAPHHTADHLIPPFSEKNVTYFDLDRRHSAYHSTADFFGLLLKVIYQRWWNLVQIDLDDSRKSVEGVCPIEAEEGGSPATLPFVTLNDKTCKKEFNIVAIVLFCIFIFVTNVAWLNVLIATLSEEVSNIEKDASRLAKFNHLIAVRSAYYRCYLPAPFSIFEIVARSLRGFFRFFISDKGVSEDSDFHDHYSNVHQHQLDEMERHCAEIVLKREDSEPLTQQN